MSTESARNPWWVVVGSTIAMIVSTGPIMFYTFGTFVGPITEEFGWNRGTISSALLIGYALAAVATPIVGKLVDSHGVRPVTLIGITLFGLGGIAMAFTSASPAVFLALWGAWGLFGAGQAPLPYARAVSAWFDEKRGIALGVTMCGVGIGAAVLPQVSRALISAYGWRGAFVGLGLITLVVGIPAVALLVHEPPRRDRTDSSTLVGVSLQEAWKSSRFWAISVAAFLVVTTVLGAVAHLVPLLTDRGVASELIASALAVIGLSTIAGRLLTGFLLDRFLAPHVAAVIFLVPLVSLALLGAGATGAGPIVAAACLGLVTGAEIDLIAFMVSRYFGLRSFGEIYGYIFSMFLLGTGVGPYLMGLCYDVTKSYNVTLAVFGLFLVIASVLISRLGAYAYPVVERVRIARDAIRAT